MQVNRVRGLVSLILLDFFILFMVIRLPCPSACESDGS